MKKIILTLILFIIVVFIFSYKGTKIRSPKNWSIGFERYANPFSGKITVVENKTGEKIFSYYDDQEINPEEIKYNDNKSKIITVFVKR